MLFNTNRVFLNVSNQIYKAAPSFLINPFQQGIYKIIYRRQGLLQVESMNGHIEAFENGFVAEEYFQINYLHFPMNGTIPPEFLEQFYVKDEEGNSHSALLPPYVKKDDYMWFVNECGYNQNIQMA